jgi:hypothetical protein
MLHAPELTSTHSARPASINRINRATHKARLITQQECNHSPHLVRPSLPRQRHRFDVPRQTPSLLLQHIQHRRPNQPRRYSINADILPADLLRRGARQAHDRVLGGYVRRRKSRSHHPGDGGRVHDAAARAHDAQFGAEAVEHTRAVDPHDQLPFVVVGEVGDADFAHAGPDHAREVGRAVEPAELFDGGLDCFLELAENVYSSSRLNGGDGILNVVGVGMCHLRWTTPSISGGCPKHDWEAGGWTRRLRW